MVATLVLQRDENGDLHDPRGHLCNAAGQRIDGQGTAILEPYAATEDAKVPLQRSFQCHRFKVNQHPVADVMPVLLKSGQSASREEVVEEMKNCRSMKQHWCRSTVMPEYGLSIFYGRLKPRSNHILPEYSCMT
ncbi:hypothetical protein F2Q70_00004199 [Brassica cretica]|uniref:Uncharacterized protein n=1 Tax=Brassica cretica TaxID=69181 RepID=A0A8S9J2I4_BRACR|nr:hypothetical protein F2Q70_00004199 [Brassica cretica]